MLIAQHVEQWNLADYRTKQLGTLYERSTHQQSTIASTLNRQLICVGVLFPDQVLGGGDEIVKYVLLTIEHSGAMPLLTVFRATAKVGQREHSSAFQPKQH